MKFTKTNAYMVLETIRKAKALLVTSALRVLCLLPALSVSAQAGQQEIYPPSAMPIVDMHTHMDAKTQYAKAVETMDQWGGTISISLAGLFWVKDNNGQNASPESVKQMVGNDMVYVKDSLENRILFVPGAFTIPKEGIWWNVDDIKTFKKQGFAGIKLWPHGSILSSEIPLIHEHLVEAGKQGMPLIGFHTGDPGTLHGNSAAFPRFEDDAIDLAAKHPQTTFIFAHGLFMLENDQGLDKLADVFDQYPNVFVDLAFTHNMRQQANYTVSKARDFYIKYRDRLLFGSDVFAAGGKADGFLKERKLLETNQVTNGLHKGPLLEGLNLPDSVLNHIYYWNAARLIPRVRQVLESRNFRIGYELGRFSFDRLPPDVTVNQLTPDGRVAELSGTLGSVTDSLVVEIAGKVYRGTDNRNGTWKLSADRIAGLPAGTYDVKVTARNSIGLVRTDTTFNELTVIKNSKRSKKTRQLSDTAGRSGKDQGIALMGNRFLTLCTLVRVNQIEISRDQAVGEDEASIHSPEEAKAFREAVAKAWPGARITWAFSWLALKDNRKNYSDLRKVVVSYHKKYGDEITFTPGGYFANMYNTREQVNRDLHEGLQMVSEMVGGGYRPLSVVAGFLAAENLRYLAEEENIHVCQGNIWSQYAIDNGDGDGSISYPYYPSREHFLKAARNSTDQIDCVNLDGWTCDFLTARRAGFANGFNSRLGVGPIETLITYGVDKGLKQMMATTATHFDEGFNLNKFAWVTNICELGLVEAHKIYHYKHPDVIIPGLTSWLEGIRSQWPDVRMVTVGEFGTVWRKQFKNNDSIDYRFVQRGSGFPGSEPNMEIRWFMNKDFRLAFLRNREENSPWKVIDFTRYDLKAQEPADPKPGDHSRNWSLMNRLNQKGIRPQDKPISINELTKEDQAIIKKRYPDLIKEISD